MGVLLGGQHDVAADGRPASVPGVVVSRFHQAGPAAGEHREALLAQARPQLSGQGVKGRVFGHPRRAKHRHARPYEMQHPKPAQKFAQHRSQKAQLAPAARGLGEKASLVARGS